MKRICPITNNKAKILCKYSAACDNYDMVDIDKTDRKILAAIQVNARATLSDLADSVHLSVSQVQRRLKRLENTNVITAYIARLDPAALGFEVAAFAEVTLKTQDTNAAEAFHRAVHLIPEIVECHRISGDADFLLRVVATDLKGYSRLAQTKILAVPEVARLRSNIVFESPKDTTELPVDQS